jgi:hypothetical protein
MFASDSLFTHLRGFNVIDCEVRHREFFYFLAREDYTQAEGWNDTKDAPNESRLEKRAVSLNLANDEAKKWGSVHLKGLDRSFCAMAFAPERKLVVVDADSRAWVHHPSTNGFETEIKSKFEGGFLRGAIHRVRGFGQQAIAVTGARGVWMRVGVSQWERIGEQPPFDSTKHRAIQCGFDDIDAFSSDSMYAVGGAGDIWHFNGSAWRQCAFPTNWGLSAVCCAGDGQVYVAASVVVYRGEGDRWTRLKTKGPKMSIPIKDLVWYEDKLWGTSDYGIWTLEGDTLVEADLPSEVKVCAGNLAVRDGVMLLAGYGGAAFKRDGQWTVIFHDHELRQMAKNP